MKAVKIGLIVLGAAAAGLIGMYAYLGGFRPVTVSRGEQSSAEIVYSTHRGPYKDLHKSWSKFKAEWEAAGLADCDALAVYLDPPGTPEEKLRSIIACRIDSLPAEQKAGIKAKLPSFTIPRSRAILSSFPYRNPISYFIGPTKVYPEFQKALSNEATPPVAIETYGSMSRPAEEIGFSMPLESSRADYAKLIDAF